MNQVILLLGTNLGDKKNNLQQAESLIEKEIGVILKKSEILESEAEDYESAHLFWNQTIRIETNLSPIQLLNQIKQIENQIGRIYTDKTQRYQDRLIDIDVLIFNELRFFSERLSIPHHQIETRKFIKKIKNYLLNG